MQNRAARVVSGVYDWSVSGIDIVSQLRWQTVRDRRDYVMCVLMYKCLNGQGPAFLQDKFPFVKHGFSTRAETSHNLTVQY